MKKLLMLTVMMLSLNSMAQVEVPALLKDSTIVTTLKNGKQYKFDGNEWMVVRRKANVADKPKEELKEAHETIVVLHKKVVELSKTQQKLNRVRVIGGVGPSGNFNSKHNANYVEIETKTSALGGVGYDRMIDDKISIGGQALSNGTFGLSLGLDF